MSSRRGSIVLNGTIEVDSTPQRGTTFTLRLPLTLAIINCLLVRLATRVFSMPIDDVREIVSVANGRRRHRSWARQTFDVRGEFVPLVSIDDIFHWHGIDYGYNTSGRASHQTDSSDAIIEVVILHAAGRPWGCASTNFWAVRTL